MVKPIIEDFWSPYSLARVCDIFQDASFFWAVGGGYAIEMFTQEHFREHEDIDLLVWRDELPKVREYLKSWEVYASDPPGTLRQWEANETLGDHVHDIWVREQNQQDWRFQLMVMDREDDLWLFRRDPSVKRLINEVIYQNGDGIHYLSPVFQLLFKAKNCRSKDVDDFEHSVTCMSKEERCDLKNLMQKIYADNHPWLSEL